MRSELFNNYKRHYKIRVVKLQRDKQLYKINYILPHSKPNWFAHVKISLCYCSEKQGRCLQNTLLQHGIVWLATGADIQTLLVIIHKYMTVLMLEKFVNVPVNPRHFVSLHARTPFGIIAILILYSNRFL